MTIEWLPEYNLGIKLIDEQHKKFVKIIDKLNNAITKHKTHKYLMKIFDDLIDYTNYHFSTEEKYFKKFHYNGTKEHIQEHNLFVNKINKLKSNSNENQLELSFELIDFLENWLIEHLNLMDKKYVKCFHKNGLN